MGEFRALFLSSSQQVSENDIVSRETGPGADFFEIQVSLVGLLFVKSREGSHSYWRGPNGARTKLADWFCS